jgi:hypothetical protein
MTIDIHAAEQFVLANGRLIDRHRLAVLLHDAPTAPVLDALRAYRNADGGFGHALEPDVRAPASEPASPLRSPHCCGRLDGDGSIAVTGGAANERLTPLMLSDRPGTRSRVLFTDAQIDADLDALERRQRDDGGWTFDWLAWSPGQSVEWRGIVTLRALATLRAHGRGV